MTWCAIMNLAHAFVSRECVALGAAMRPDPFFVTDGAEVIAPAPRDSIFRTLCG